MFHQDIQKFDINLLHKTKDGYYQGNVVCTGVGVFKYLGDDRKFVGRLRDVEDVKAATKTINCIPVTLQHPNQPVTADNVDGLQVGMTANDASFDGLNNHVTVTITGKKAIEAIDKGEVKAFSMGYKCSIVDNDGVWQGVHHDQQQKDIVYNHIALVKNGRAGDKVRFMVGDSADLGDIFEVEDTEGSSVVDDPENKNDTPEPSNDGADQKGGKSFVNDDKNLNHNDNKEQSMKTIQLDGVDYQADEKVIEALQAAQNDAAVKTDEIHTLLAGIDERDSEIADLKGQLETANDEIDESVIDAAVNAKLAILDAARAAGIECDTSDDVSDLKRQVISAAFDGVDLDSIEDESSINALFASANKVIADRAEKADQADGCGKGGTKKNPAAQLDGAAKGGSKDDQNDSAEDRLQKRMIQLSNGIKEDK